MKSNLWIEKKRLIEERLDSASRFEGSLLHLYLDQVGLPDRSTSTREWVAHPGACVVLPIFEDGSILLVKQYRYPLQQIFLEVPAGKIDPNEPPERTASRESEEETGHRAEKLAYIGHFYPVVGYSDEIIHIYAGWDLEKTEASTDHDEFLVTVRLHFSEALQLIDSGIITDGKSICALYRIREWWRNNGPFAITF